MIADEDILIAAGFSGVANLISRLDTQSAEQKLSKAFRIPIISDLLSDYFDGDFNSLNGIRTRQPGAKFSQDVWKVMRKIPAGMTISYAELAKRAGSVAAVRAAGTACGNNLIAPIIWIGIVYVTYLAMNKYFPENLTLAIIIYTISFLGTLSRGFKAYK